MRTRTSAKQVVANSESEHEILLEDGTATLQSRISSASPEHSEHGTYLDSDQIQLDNQLQEELDAYLKRIRKLAKAERRRVDRVKHISNETATTKGPKSATIKPADIDEEHIVLNRQGTSESPQRSVRSIKRSPVKPVSRLQEKMRKKRKELERLRSEWGVKE